MTKAQVKKLQTVARKLEDLMFEVHIDEAAPLHTAWMKLATVLEAQDT